MKSNYFYYYFTHRADIERKVRFNLKPFLDSFASYNNPTFKRRFYYHEEHVFLIPHIPDLKIFLRTHSQDLMQRINLDNISVADLNQLLQQSEQLGFSGLVYNKDYHFAIASGLMAPRFDAFSYFVNQLLNMVGVHDWNLHVVPFNVEIDRNDVLNLEHVGATSVRVDKTHSVFRRVAGELGLNDEDQRDIDNLEITIRPVKRANIKDQAVTLMQQSEDDGLEKFMMRGKQEAGSRMLDLYLHNRGALCDIVKTNYDAELPGRIKALCDNNDVLTGKVKDFCDDERYEDYNIPILADIRTVDDWDRVVRGLQVPPQPN